MKRTPKRYEYHVTYDAAANLWVCKVGGALFDRCPQRDHLINRVDMPLSVWAQVGSQHSELIIHRKDGTIGKGSSSRRTYGGDPKGTKG